MSANILMYGQPESLKAGARHLRMLKKRLLSLTAPSNPKLHRLSLRQFAGSARASFSPIDQV